ncbi:hypothetical protein [Tellurirhabdus rosea]|uniref:hypothetical protein n=1 Tax=Tellurirhabdus rosea TaxID=2674997 RepID=UPI00224E620A|nr:hypothetical protein [Tellurirhabdus rosea]
MKYFLCSLVGLLGSLAASAQTISADSSRRSSPDVLRLGTYFYRQPGDSKNVMRAGLDNMPVRLPDSSGIAVMPNKYPEQAPRMPSLPQPKKDQP